MKQFFSAMLIFAVLGLSAEIHAVAKTTLLPSARPDEVDRIEINGVTVFPAQDIEEVVEIEPGDSFDRIKILRTAENIRNLYKLHGYEQSKIETRRHKSQAEDGSLENVLEFSVKEGLPTRIASIQYFPQNIAEEAFEKYWSHLETTLVEKFANKVGDIYDQEKIASGRRGIQDALASEEFIGAKVEDLKVYDTAPPLTGLTAEEKKNAGRWVELEVYLDLGDRVTFGFRGNTVFPSTRLNALVDEQRVLGLGKDYIGSIKARIEDEYHSLGYAKVQITPLTFEGQTGRERHVTYVINEGPRVQISSLQFDGNVVFNERILENEFYRKASTVVQHGYFVSKDVHRAADLLIEWMRSKGYLTSKIVTINTLYNSRSTEKPEGSEARLIVYLYEGDQTLVESVKFKGITVFTPEKVKAVLGIREGEPLNLFSFSEGIDSLKSLYRSKGYLGMNIKGEGGDDIVKYSEENRIAEINLEVLEGPQYRVSHIIVDGLTLTREHVVRRELRFYEGGVLQEPDVTETEARLRRLGIFSSVNIRTLDDPEQSGYKLVRISLEEGTPGIIAIGAGLRNDLGVRVFGQTAYTNLGGRNQTLSLLVNSNRRFVNYRFVEYQAQLAYIWPWFIANELTFRPTLTVSGTEYFTFDATTVSAAATLERTLLQNPKLRASLTYSLERVNQFNAQISSTDNQDLRIGSLTPTLILDMRDHPLSPTSGLFSQTSFEYASPLLFSQVTPYRVGYYRFQFRTDYFVPIMGRINLFLSFRTGFERNDELPIYDSSGNPLGGIPLIKQFALGGIGSLRGWQEQELNYQDRAVLGTMSYVNYRTQLDFPLAGSLKVGPFLDAANLNIDQFSFGDLHYGTGAGLHYQTPVGPVNLDWGFKLGRDAPGKLFYFSIGII